MLHLSPLAIGQQLTAGIEGESIFRGLLSDMQFQQHAHHPTGLGSLFLDFAQQLQRVHRLDHRDIGGDILHLVGLQMTDEMPLDIAGQRLHLAGQFLLVALAKDALALLVGRSNIFLGVELTDSHELHPLRERLTHFV